MTGYRPPSTEPRGKWAKAIHAKRRADGLSQVAAFELLGARLGFASKSRAAYAAIDMGSREPTEREQEVLVDWLGGYPDDMVSPGQGDTRTPGEAAYLERVDDLVRVVTRLLDELPAARREVADLRERVAGLEAAARLREPLDTEDDGERAARPRRAG